MRISLASSTRALFAGAACLMILVGMLVGHAWPLWAGQMVVLPVRPVDPRDLFRGEFVRLDTPLTTVIAMAPGSIPSAEGLAIPVVGEWLEAEDRVGSLVYVQLEPRLDAAAAGSVNSEYHAVSISAGPVPSTINLRGRIVQAGTSHTDYVRIAYGLDAFFMQEGTAIGIEEAMRAGKRVQMEVAIAASGRARIRNLIVDGTPLPR